MPDGSGIDPKIGRDKLVDLFETRFSNLANQLTEGEIDLGTWQITMRAELRNLHALQLVSASGVDKSNVDPDDWLMLGSQLKSQYGYLEDFANQIADGELSADQIDARAQLYAGTSKGTWYRQYLKDAIELPAYPGDGSTPCLGRCGCEWIEQNGDWYWVRGKDDSCTECVKREKEWAPYIPDGDE